MLILPRERNRWFQDAEGCWATSKREDEIIQMVIDWSEELAEIGSSETIASVAYDDSGVTRTGTANTTTTTTDKITGTGQTEVTVTTSGGYKLQRLVRFYSQEGAAASDYA